MDPSTVFNITMIFFGLPPPPATPNIGVRVDFWDPAANSYPANSSIFFYQTGTSVPPPPIFLRIFLPAVPRFLSDHLSPLLPSFCGLKPSTGEYFMVGSRCARSASHTVNLVVYHFEGSENEWHLELQARKTRCMCIAIKYSYMMSCANFSQW